MYKKEIRVLRAFEFQYKEKSFYETALRFMNVNKIRVLLI
ncbi:hypothetical protein LEP1GSC125_1973 [Leptospira mayottensis 200901122]|uniref:Uncharacterized protein n=1 Tax=Leptospira mayottensis 200901122 TaxID=1193010 RepID=A0AA87SXQ7_9LEPT|nr:hypothetical protein LEP1GSC125_1973 [Leptospira mayottensis 200901122]